MKRFVPDARFLVILRDPAKRAWSHYWFMCMVRHEVRSFARALEEESHAANSDNIRER